jgi:hypothetical protein
MLIYMLGKWAYLAHDEDVEDEGVVRVVVVDAVQLARLLVALDVAEQLVVAVRCGGREAEDGEEMSEGEENKGFF